MTNKFLINWAIWIGTLTGIYVFIYLLTPLGSYGIIWMTFVALPIYFNGGAKPEEYLAYLLSMIMGVIWGFIYLKGIDAVIAVGVPPVLATAVTVGVICIVQCALHFVPPISKTPVKVVPIMFGAIAMCFSQGGTNFIPIAITMFGGLTLGLLCGLGGKVITPEGNWTFLQKK